MVIERGKGGPPQADITAAASVSIDLIRGRVIDWSLLQTLMVIKTYLSRSTAAVLNINYFEKGFLFD